MEPLVVFRRPLFVSLSAHFMQIRSWGHRAKLFAAWPTVNFHFDKPRSHCSLPVCRCRFIAHQLPFCLLELSSCAAPYQRGLVCPPGRLFALCVLRASVISLLIAVLLLVSLVARALCVLWWPVQWIHSFTRTAALGATLQTFCQRAPPHPPPCRPSPPLLPHT